VGTHPGGGLADGHLPTAAWINKPASIAARAEPADQHAPQGVQAGAAVVQEQIPAAAVEVGTSTASFTL
jgi:hypothetical protein